MKERAIVRFSILIFWTFFWGLSVADKIIPDVHNLWVGKDFFALFIMFKCPLCSRSAPIGTYIILFLIIIAKQIYYLPFF